MRRVAFLHIGHPKTATTFLQSTMHLNVDLLHRAGLDVPSDFTAAGYWDFVNLSRRNHTHSGNASPLFFALEGGDMTKAAQLVAMLQSDRDLILSSELLFYHPQKVQWIAGALQNLGYYTHVIAYLGAYLPMAVQSYCQNIRNGGYWQSFADFLRDPPDRRFLRFGTLYAMLWSMAEVDRVSFRPNASALLRHGDIVDDLFAIVAPNLIPSALTRPIGRLNASLPIVTLEALRLANREGDKSTIQRLRDARAIEADSERTMLQAFYATPEARMVLEQNYAADRARFVSYMPEAFQQFWSADPPLEGATVLARSEVEA